MSGGANNLLTIDQTVGNAFVQITLAQSTFGAANSLQLSSSSIENTGLTPINDQAPGERHQLRSAGELHPFTRRP